MIEKSLDWFIPDCFVIDGYSSWLYGNWVVEDTVVAEGSGTLILAQSNNYKAPPILTDDVDYEKWKKEIKIWRMLTSL